MVKGQRHYLNVTKPKTKGEQCGQLGLALTGSSSFQYLDIECVSVRKTGGKQVVAKWSVLKQRKRGCTA